TAQDPVDPNPLNNTSAVSVNAASDADLQVTKAVSDAAPAVGSQITYTIAVANAGPAAATNAAILDALPPGLTFVSGAASEGTYDQATGVWTLGAIPVSGTETLSITARVDAIGALSNTVTRQASSPADPNTANDTASAASTPVLVADVAVAHTPSVPVVVAGTTFRWTVVVTNHGP